MNKITIVQHGNGYKAYLNGNTSKWEYGTTKAEAVSALLHSHSKEIGITINDKTTSDHSHEGGQGRQGEQGIH